LAKQLPPTFLRINRSCLINPDHIQEIDFRKKAIRPNDELWLPVSRAEWKRLSEDLKEDFSKRKNAQIDEKTKERIDLSNPKHFHSKTASPLPLL
jgi:hypothetical protein